MRYMPAAMLATVTFIAGCDSMNWEQYRVAGVRPGSSDAARLEAVIAEVATEAGLEDRTSNSRVPQTIALYVEPDVEHFRVELGARFHQGDALVDVMAGFGPIRPAFKRTDRAVAQALRAAFGTRLSKLKPAERLNPTLEAG